MYKDKLKELRENDKISQAEISQILGIKRGVYSIFETENKLMPIKHINTLSTYFNVSVDYLFGLSSNTKYSNSRNISIELATKRLKEFRKENKITQIELAKELNIANGTIANYECGRNLIATPFLYQICKKYKISADYLLGKVDSPKYLN